MFRIHTYPRGLYREYTAHIVLRLPCCCSGHNIIPTTHRRNEPFIAALLGCCFLSQAADTTTSCFSSPNRRPRSWPFSPPSLSGVPLPPFSRPSRTHTCIHYPRCVTLRIRAVPVHARRVAAPALARSLARSCVRSASRVTKISWESHSPLIIAAATFPKDDYSRGRT